MLAAATALPELSCSPSYMIGLVFRPQRQWLRMGPDSLAVLILYAIGITGLAFIAR